MIFGRCLFLPGDKTDPSHQTECVSGVELSSFRCRANGTWFLLAFWAGLSNNSEWRGRCSKGSRVNCWRATGLKASAAQWGDTSMHQVSTEQPFSDVSGCKSNQKKQFHPPSHPPLCISVWCSVLSKSHFLMKSFSQCASSLQTPVTAFTACLMLQLPEKYVYILFTAPHVFGILK